MTAKQHPPRFRLCLALKERETAQSYLARLSLYFGCRSPREFCRDYGLDLRGIQHGNANALHQLAVITGADTQELLRWTPTRISTSHMSLNGEVLHTRVNARHIVRICPECAKLDIEANPRTNWDQAVYVRAEWVIGVVEVCAIHGVEFVSQRGPILDLVRIDLASQTSEILSNLPRIDSTPATLGHFHRYVLSRIGALPPRPSPLLDELPLAAVAQICHAAGSDVSQRLGLKHPTPTQRREAGFDLFGHGAEHFECRFLEIRQGLRVTDKASSIFLRLLDYLRVDRILDPQFTTFLKAFTDVLFRNLPYGAGDIVAGRACPRRALHNYNSAASAYGLGRHQIRAFVEGKPELIAQYGARRQDALIYAEIADQTIPERMPFLNSAEVSRRLGRKSTVPTKDLQIFIRAGILKPETDVSPSISKMFFSARHVDEAMATIRDRCRPMRTEEQGMVSTHLASATFGMSYDTLWSLIAKKEIEALGMRPDVGFAKGLRVSISELLMVLTGATNPMLATEVSKILCLSQKSLRELVDGGYLSSARVSNTAMPKISEIFDRREVSRFHAHYVSLQELRKQTTWRPTLQKLKDIGIEPAIQVYKPTVSPARNWTGTILALFERHRVSQLL